jgi:hypothetical protein
MNDKSRVLHILFAMFPDYQNSGQMAGLASHLIECAKSKETERVSQFFEQVEFQMIYGSEEVRKMLLVELLENLKNLASMQNLDYAIFEPWLGPETHVAWRWLEKRWQGRASLADSLRSEKKSE